MRPDSKMKLSRAECLRSAVHRKPRGVKSNCTSEKVHLRPRKSKFLAKNSGAYIKLSGLAPRKNGGWIENRLETGTDRESCPFGLADYVDRRHGAGDANIDRQVVTASRELWTLQPDLNLLLGQAMSLAWRSRPWQCAVGECYFAAHEVVDVSTHAEFPEQQSRESHN